MTGVGREGFPEAFCPPWKTDADMAAAITQSCREGLGFQGCREDPALNTL